MGSQAERRHYYIVCQGPSFYRQPEHLFGRSVETDCFDDVSAFSAAVFESKRTMMWESILTEWASLILRWLHVVAAV
ncbi:hypothetical protein, partial [Bradyrhizobium sp.]|uniref:hypothetical protein n=1 Tax=Bradyrhizobium sp. TaxID=376 RepID=UPI003C76E8CB